MKAKNKILNFRGLDSRSIKTKFLDGLENTVNKKAFVDEFVAIENSRFEDILKSDEEPSEEYLEEVLEWYKELCLLHYESVEVDSIIDPRYFSMELTELPIIFAYAHKVMDMMAMTSMVEDFATITKEEINKLNQVVSFILASQNDGFIPSLKVGCNRFDTDMSYFPEEVNGESVLVTAIWSVLSIVPFLEITMERDDATAVFGLTRSEKNELELLSTSDLEKLIDEIDGLEYTNYQFIPSETFPLLPIAKGPWTRFLPTIEGD